ncbi:hypothetical protein GW17_00050532 [Ensete ventricosum]|nr:hypothetical protein GW17_00050532 [Ensete ventricosum]
MPPPSSSSSFTAAVAAPALYARRQVRRFFSSDSRLRPRADRRRGWWPLALAFTAQGPCCLYIGPVETASKEMLEALYQQVLFPFYLNLFIAPFCELEVAQLYHISLVIVLFLICL